MKLARFGKKSYLLCESKSSYKWCLIIYTGKGTIQNVYTPVLTVSTQVVKSLMEQLLGKGYCLTFNNFYFSPELTNFLIL